jgi:outer membrane beta-barrel protein
VKRTLSIVSCLALLAAFQARADETRSLKERIRSVSNQLYGKGGRLELTLFPLSSFSLNDAFFQKYGGGLSIGYHFSNSWAFQIMGTYSLNMELSNASYHGSVQEQVPDAGKRNFLAGAELMWAPLYGKISLAADSVWHFDTYVTAGAGALGSLIEEDDAEVTNVGVAAAVGIGVHVFFTRSLALKLEFKDYMVFTDKVTFLNQKESDVQHQLMFNLGFSIFMLDSSAED